MSALALERYRWLIQHGRELLSEPTAGTRRGLTDWQIALLEQQRAWRKRSRHRFPDSHLWLWTDQSLAQASDFWCAQFKASLFPVGADVLDACCGVGSDLVALAARGPTTGIDSDAVLAELAESNVRAHGFTASVRVAVLPQQWPQDVPWLHIDPDRRAQGVRSTNGQAFSPALSDVLDMAETTQGAVIKLAPSTTVPGDLAERMETLSQRIWVGNLGECRQQILLTGQLMREDAARRAYLCEPRTFAETHSGSDGATRADDNMVVHEFFGEASEPCPVELLPGRYVFDLHNVLHAADLQAHFAERNGMRCLDDPHGYYSGDQLVESAWCQAFEVQDVIAWDDRKVRKWLRAHAAGSVEVKCRSVKVDANAFQRRYSNPSGAALTLLVTRLGPRVRAIIARRIASLPQP